MDRPNRDEFDYRMLVESDLPALSRLIGSMSKAKTAVLELRDNSEDYYRWMYFQNPAGNAVVAGAWHADRLVSSFAVAPKRIKVGSEIHTYGKTMDMFTDPDYQGLGIMSLVTKMVFKEAQKRGIDHWYVTPSGKSYPIFKNKWNYEEPFELEYRTILLDPQALAASISGGRARRLAFRAGATIVSLFTRLVDARVEYYSVEEVDRFPVDMDAFWDSVNKRYGNLLVRDAAYLNWRFCDNPDNYTVFLFRDDQAIVGYIVTKITIRRGVKTGEIVDLLYSPRSEQTGVDMIRHATRVLSNQSCALVETWDYSGCPLRSAYRRAGLRYKRATLRFMLSPGGPNSGFYDFGAWYVTQADGNDV